MPHLPHQPLPPAQPQPCVLRLPEREAGAPRARTRPPWRPPASSDTPAAQQRPGEFAGQVARKETQEGNSEATGNASVPKRLNTTETVPSAA